MQRFFVGRRGLIGLALLYTLLNAPKPLTVDDGAYYYFARQIAHDPLHPYAFTMHWYTYPQPANEVLAPPVLPYWLSGAYAVGGERPWVWKLSLFPFALMFVGALHALARRLARSLEWPVVLLIVLSPLFLPSFNLMLDVPATALGLTALALFARACGRRSVGLALLAGLAAGLAMQTKYTALATPAVIMIYALVMGRWALGLLTATTAAAVFVGIEGFLWYQHGASHFLVNLKDTQHAQQLEFKLAVARALLPMLGGLAPGLILLALATLRAPGWLLTGVAALLAATYAAVGLTDFTPLLFGLWGFVLAGLALAAVVRLVLLHSPLGGAPGAAELGVRGEDSLFDPILASGASNGPGPSSEPPSGPGPLLAPLAKRGAGSSIAFRLSLFVILWLMLEVSAYVPLAPFPAARRVMGVVIACTFVLGRLAALLRPALAPWAVNGAVAGGALAGLLFCGVDLVDALVQQNAPEAAAEWIAQQPVAGGQRPATVWYTGHWGFQYYAERAGMKAVVPFYPGIDYSRLRPGDWLVVPDDRWNQQWITVEPHAAAVVQMQAIPRTLPWRTVQCFYGGHMPLEHHPDRRIAVTIYRITEPWSPSAR